MKEIEILVQVFADEADVMRKLSEFEFLGNKRTVDTYYYDPLRPELQPDGNGRLYACCRTRQKDGVNYITYKNDHFDGDTVLIYNAQNRNDYIRAKIVRLHIAHSFADLATKISMPRTGFFSLEYLMNAISKFYDEKLETKYGIVGIEIDVLK